MITQTTEFFEKPTICNYKLRTYEDNDKFILNVTFYQVQNANAYIMYKKVG